MNRERAEKLLAALIFDDLDDASKAELLAYLQTDDELRDRLADMRMAVKLACDAVKDGPDPVLSEHRLTQLKQLAKAGRTRGRILTMHRSLAAAAVLMFGLVLVGLLVPSLSKVHYQKRSYPASAEEQLYTQSKLTPWQNAPSGQSGSDVGQVVTEARFRRFAAPRVEADAAGNYGGGMMAGMGAEDVVNGVSARSVRDSDRYNIETTGGSSLGVTTPVASVPPAVLPSPPVPMLGRGSDLSKQLSVLRSRGGKEALEQATEMNDRLYIDQPSSGPVPVDGSGFASAKQPGGVMDEEEVRRRLAGLKSAEAGGEVRYGWSGTVTSQKPAEPMSILAPTDSVVNSDRKRGTAVGVAGAVEADRVPILGDKPIVGEFFRRSELEAKKDYDLEAVRDLRAGAEEVSNEPSIRLDEVRGNVKLELGESPVQVVEQEEAGVPSTSHFQVVPVNPWVMTDRDRLSTFALDVDTASYALCRRYIRSGFLPPIGAVRMEEFINAFDYAYPQRDDATFAVYAEGAPSPFAPAGQDVALLKIAVKARTIGRDQRRAAHLVFVVDASASMGQADRLPAVQAALNLLVDKLSEVDRVSLITCANEARLHLEAVPAQQKDVIRQAIDGIQPAGPTNLMAGLQLGYAMARKAFVAGRINQVVLCSDGVANVGQTEAQAVLDEVAGDRKQGITLTCVGVGYGAYNDAFLEAMADRGDGRYVFLDSSGEARDALVGQLAATLQTVAKDARIQVEFNPARVRRYRLIGYENRDIEDQRFRDDTVDAGEVGSGQCSTALYELELVAPSSTDADTNLGTVFVRYRHAESGQIEEISRPLAGSLIRRRSVEEDPRFFLAAGAARFAEWLRQSEHAQHTSLADVQRVLDHVSAALPLDRDVQDLAALAHQAENLPRASPAAPQP